MVKRVDKNLRVIPGPAFNITFQHVFVSSIPYRLRNELFKRFSNNTGRLVGISSRLKRDFLREYFNVDVEMDILKKREEISRVHGVEREEIINHTGLGKKELPKWFIKKFNEYIEEYDKERKQ